MPKPNTELTSIAEYAAKTTEVIETLIRRAQQVRGRGHHLPSSDG